MPQAVSIKGTKSGIILALDNNISFVQLKQEITDQFTKAASFLGNASMGLIIRGRHLSDVEQAEVLDIIHETTNLNIVCVMDQEHPMEAAFAQAVGETRTPAKAPSYEQPREVVSPQAMRPAGLSEEEKRRLQSEAYDEAYQAAFEQIGDANARIHVGNLRSGQEIVSQHSLIIFGDVNPGGSVVSAGCIFVFGSLKGMAFAGATGDTNAFVMAMDFNPLQVRIADQVAVAEDEETVKGRRFALGRSKRQKSVSGGPEVAYTYQGAIARSEFNKMFLRGNQFFK